jgi:hypothetical protein
MLFRHPSWVLRLNTYDLSRSVRELNGEGFQVVVILISFTPSRVVGFRMVLYFGRSSKAEPKENAFSDNAVMKKH